MGIATTRWSEKNDPSDDDEIAEIVRGFLVEQARTAADQNRPLRRGTHAKGICARAVFDVCDLTTVYAPALAARLAKSVFASPGQHPATVRFAMSSSSMKR
jgi:catalase